MKKPDSKVAENIAEFGCHVIHVLEEGDETRFTYSIGIEECTGQPELIVTGLKRELAHWIVNEYNGRIQKGEVFEIGKKYEGFIGDFEVFFMPVEKRHYDEYFGQSQLHYQGDNFSVLQLVFPSTSGVWHWEPEANDDFKWFIPQLYAT